MLLGLLLSDLRLQPIGVKLCTHIGDNIIHNRTVTDGE